MLYIRKLNFVFLLSHLVVNISTTNIDKAVSAVSTLKQRRKTYVGSTFTFN